MMRLRSSRGCSDRPKSEESENGEDDDCRLCSNRVVDAEHAVRCDACSRWCHTKCIAKAEDQCEITLDIYSRLSDTGCQFICGHCKSEEAPKFLQSLFNSRIISRKEVKDLAWDQYIDLEDVESDGKDLGQGDASNTSQTFVKTRHLQSESLLDYDPFAKPSNTSFIRVPEFADSSPLVPGPSNSMNAVNDSVLFLMRQMKEDAEKHDKERKDNEEKHRKEHKDDEEKREEERKAAAKEADRKWEADLKERQNERADRKAEEDT